jgi:hypothetical protein
VAAYGWRLKFKMVMKKVCIYCDSKGKKSKEHIWPVWMHQHLLLLGDGENVSEVNTFRWKEQTGSRKSTRQGHLTTKKIRVVCQSCNSGWMSYLENATKPILLKVLNGESIDLCAVEQETLARWIAMKAIIGEYAENDTHMTPREDRILLRLENKIPNYFAIYIGVHNASSDSAWLRTSQTIALSPEGPSPPLGKLKRNMQSIAFICGKLFVFVFAVRENGIKPTEVLKLKKLQRIYPKQSNIVKWPPADTLTKLDMGRIAWAVDDMKNLPNVKNGGDIQ